MGTYCDSKFLLAGVDIMSPPAFYSREEEEDEEILTSTGSRGLEEPLLIQHSQPDYGITVSTR